MKIKTDKNVNDTVLNQQNVAVKTGDTKFKEDLKDLNKAKILVEEVEKETVSVQQSDKSKIEKSIDLNETPYVYVAKNFIPNKDEGSVLGIDSDENSLKNELAPNIKEVQAVIQEFAGEFKPEVKAVMQEFAGEFKPEVKAVMQEFAGFDKMQNVPKQEKLNGTKISEIQIQQQLKQQVKKQENVSTVLEKQNVPKVEQKPAEVTKVRSSELLTDLLKEPVDFVKKVPSMEEVVPQQLRTIAKKDAFSQSERLELKNVSNKETSAIVELRKFMNETFSQEAIEDLKVQNPSIQDENALLNDEIKNYYNLHKAKNAAMMDDIQNIITERVSALNEVSKAISSTRETSEIQRELSSIETKSTKAKKEPETKALKMTEKDATFFANLVKNSEVTEQVTAETNKTFAENVKQVTEEASTATVSKALADMIGEASKTNKPFRIDFDKDISVIIKVDKDGKISAEFLPGDKAVEQYLRNSMPLLKQKFNDEQIDYKELNYRQSNKQNRERKNKENKNE